MDWRGAVGREDGGGWASERASVCVGGAAEEGAGRGVWRGRGATGGRREGEGAWTRGALCGLSGSAGAGRRGETGVRVRRCVLLRILLPHARVPVRCVSVPLPPLCHGPCPVCACAACVWVRSLSASLPPSLSPALSLSLSLACAPGCIARSGACLPVPPSACRAPSARLPLCRCVPSDSGPSRDQREGARRECTNGYHKEIGVSQAGLARTSVGPCTLQYGITDRTRVRLLVMALPSGVCGPDRPLLRSAALCAEPGEASAGLRPGRRGSRGCRGDPVSVRPGSGERGCRRGVRMWRDGK